MQTDDFTNEDCADTLVMKDEFVSRTTKRFFFRRNAPFDLQFKLLRNLGNVFHLHMILYER